MAAQTDTIARSVPSPSFVKTESVDLCAAAFGLAVSDVLFSAHNGGEPKGFHITRDNGGGKADLGRTSVSACPPLEM